MKVKQFIKELAKDYAYSAVLSLEEDEEKTLPQESMFYGCYGADEIYEMTGFSTCDDAQNYDENSLADLLEEMDYLWIDYAIEEMAAKGWKASWNSDIIGQSCCGGWEFYQEKEEKEEKKEKEWEEEDYYRFSMITTENM